MGGQWSGISVSSFIWFWISHPETGLRISDWDEIWRAVGVYMHGEVVIRVWDRRVVGMWGRWV